MSIVLGSVSSYSVVFFPNIFADYSFFFKSIVVFWCHITKSFPKKLSKIFYFCFAVILSGLMVVVLLVFV